MRMHGSWHIYRPGERWQRPRHEMRIVIATAPYVAVAFAVPVAEFVEAAALEREGPVAELGPDLLSDTFDAAAAVARLQARGDLEIADALLDQRAIAGIGNVFKSEILFAARVSPFTRVQALDADDARPYRRDRGAADAGQRGRRGCRGGGRPDHDQPARSVGAPLGVRAARPPVPAVRHADSARQAGTRHALDLLVRTLSATRVEAQP